MTVARFGHMLADEVEPRIRLEAPGRSIKGPEHSGAFPAAGSLEGQDGEG